MAKKLRRLKNHGTFAGRQSGECCARVRGRKRHAEPVSEEDAEDDEMQTVLKQDLNWLEWDAIICERCGELAPTLSVGEALSRFLGKDEVLDRFTSVIWSRILARVCRNPSRCLAMRRGARIEKRAMAERRPDESMEMAISRLMVEDIGDGTLYSGYLAERGE